MLTLLLLAAALNSCIFSEIREDEPVGESCVLDMSLTFKPMESVSPGTRTAGNAIRHIESLWFLAYNEDGSLYSKTRIASFTQVEESCNGYAESTYCHTSFKYSLPLGRYRCYAVANYDLSSFSGSEIELKNIRIDWNASDVASNAAMFGYFSSSDTAPTSYDAPLLTVNRSSSTFYAWVRRVASKLTVSYDASALKDNIYIYLKSVQIMDIPAGGLLGANNVPSSAAELIHDGEKLLYSSSDNIQDWPFVTKGNPVYEYDGGHGETSQALFFFENLQGSGTKHNYHPDDPSWDKDKKTCGTYIEVKGYYVNRTADNASQGPIIYRFMLGKDVTSDFNAERNNHYKITLCFRNDANDPDWHIVYEPEQPQLSIPDPVYISYVPNESVNIPVVVRGGTSSTQVKAEIIESHWYGDKGHKYDYLFTEASNGIISLAKTGDGAATLTGSSNPAEVLPDRCLYNIPVYTRGLTLGSSLSGYNYFPHDTVT